MEAGAASSLNPEASTMQSLLEELQRLRVEREQERRELLELRRQPVAGGEPEQLSRSRNIPFSEPRIKPDTYDGTVPLREFLRQFEIIARANSWCDSEKSVQLAAHLRGKARSVLDSWDEGMSYVELKSRMELRFGERENFANAYTQFSNRKQRSGEDFAAFGGELERLARVAYPECSTEIRDKIACAQFIAALSDGFVKRTLQLENVTSLKSAIERAITVQLIQETSFPRGNSKFTEQRFESPQKGGSDDERNDFFRETRNKGNFERRNSEMTAAGEGSRSKNFGGLRREKRFNAIENKKECWNCGKQGHFRAECPTFQKGKQSN